MKTKFIYNVLIALFSITSSFANEEKSISLPDSQIITLVHIPAGEFLMGSPDSEIGRNSSEKLHKVKITKPFWMGKTEITQEQFASLMSPYTPFFKGKNLPADKVSWDSALEFCKKLNQKEKNNLPDGYEYRLPTEAEWEYASRANSSTSCYAGNIKNKTGINDVLENIAWYSENSNGKTHPVAQKNPNAFGLYDMIGNVAEWCYDWYSDYSGSLDPKGSTSGSEKIFRGGSWDCTPRLSRSASRCYDFPDASSTYVGFRIVLAPKF